MGKLVRDRIPELIGTDCKYRVLSEQEYEQELYKKLQEEVSELLADPDSLEELVDVFTVLTTIVQVKGISDKDLALAIFKKGLEKGLFEERYYLEN